MSLPVAPPKILIEYRCVTSSMAPKCGMMMILGMKKVFISYIFMYVCILQNTTDLFYFQQ